VLIPLFSLRSEEGFGLGEIPDLRGYADWAAAAGLSVVQLLPVAAVNPGETSPYSAATAFAIDPAYLGLAECEDFQAVGGIAGLSDEDRRLLDELRAAPTVQWARLRPLKERAMRAAFAHFHAREWKKKTARQKRLAAFRTENAAWLEDFALFWVLHGKFQAHWKDWDKPLADREPAALAKAARAHQDELLYVAWQQWQLDEQWRRARAHANARGVELMGDLPFVVAGDSADVWKDRHLFKPGMRVGVPPDALCADGQDWGLPLYDWAALAKTDFAWMHQRAARSGRLFGLYRVDHVIGMYRTFYRADHGKSSGFSPTDEDDQIQLGETLLSIMGAYGEVIAEDLGLLPEFLRPSLSRLRIPGYLVMRWEKHDQWRDGRNQSFYRDPAGWPASSVATSGTHDTETQAAWYDQLSPDQRRDLFKIEGLADLDPHRPFHDEARDRLLGVLYRSPSALCLLPFQDLLGHREQVNVPGTVNDGNWTYRMPMTLAALLGDRETAARLRGLSEGSGRQPG
jgi:4-alpha-glucanotransferase